MNLNTRSFALVGKAKNWPPKKAKKLWWVGKWGTFVKCTMYAICTMYAFVQYTLFVQCTLLYQSTNPSVLTTKSATPMPWRWSNQRDENPSATRESLSNETWESSSVGSCRRNFGFGYCIEGFVSLFGGVFSTSFCLNGWLIEHGVRDRTRMEYLVVGKKPSSSWLIPQRYQGLRS
jgi:hypothetical protein